jgi:hypothetical protein
MSATLSPWLAASRTDRGGRSRPHYNDRK